MYRTLSKLLKRLFTDAQIYKHGFNLSPMYRRSTGKIVDVSDDLHHVKIKIPLSYKNKNYVGAIFGGSMFSATDPIYMIQLMQILDDSYVVWDKAATIKYKRPAKETLFGEFTFSAEDIKTIKKDVAKQGEINLHKNMKLVNVNTDVFAEVEKTIYVASKSHYKNKLKQRQQSNS